MRHGRFIATVLAAAATMAVGPTMASAATSSLVDDSVADFSLGTPGSLTTVVQPGSVELNRAMVTEPFAGPGLPDDVTTKQWSPPDGSATVASGALVVQGALVRENRAYDPGQVMEFTATFSGESFQHVGFAANDFVGDVPYAIVSDNSSPTISARTYSPGGAESTTDLGVTAGTPHSFRIEWSPTEVKYYVDGATTPAATHAIAIASPMNPIVSDANAGDGSGLSVDSLGLQIGTFESRLLDAGDPHAAWGSLSATVTGSGVSFETRSGNGAGWSAWQPLGPGGAIQSPAARYIQYRSLLTAASPATVERVQVNYTDDSAPDATIDGVQVVGTTARFAFSSPAADVAGFQCAVDGSPFTSCASPTELTSLAPGAHTMAVRAIDGLGNVGQAVSRSFSIDGPAASSSGSSAAAASAAKAADTTAPRITVVVPSARASKRGTVAVRVGCPATETSCTITVALKRGRTTVAHKTVTVRGGKTVKVTLQLTQAARRQLTRDRRLKLSAVITARDAAGNRSSSTKRLTLRA
jgi:hypothetical protein